MAAIAVSIRSTPLMVLGTRSAAATPRGVHTDRADQIRALLAIADVPAAITSLGLTYAAGIVSTTTVWAPGASRCRQRNGRVADDDRSCCGVTTSIGRSRSRRLRLVYRRGPGERSNGVRARPNRCVPALRVRVAQRDYWLAESRSEEWLLIEWPKGESEPTKYWLSTLPQNVAFRDLVTQRNCAGASSATIRSSSRSVGLGHFEGRGWRGFHHHATLCIAAYGFLISERATISPSASRSA